MPRAGRPSFRTAAAVVAARVAFPLMREARLKEPERAVDATWTQLPIRPRGQTLLGISFRPRQVEAFGLDAKATLGDLLAYPFDLIRLGAYWNRIEARPGEFDTGELDRQL